LQEQEGLLLSQLDQVHGDLTKERQQYVSNISERKSLLDRLVVEIEKKRDQPVVEFLMVRAVAPLRVVSPRSCEAAKAPIPEPVSPELQRTVKNLSELSQLVVDAVSRFKGKAKKQRAIPLKVTLDPETMSPYLILSKDRKTVRMGDGQGKLLDTPKRFTGSPSVLGCQG
ncbi:TRI15 protein, partial [Nycticryphes semicollaris]|nr:TRI15 protein [Nycticryphes semicollaris]